MRQGQKKRKKNSRGGFLTALGILLLLGVIVLCAPLTVPRAFGYQIYAAIDFNYGPEVSEGSLIYVEQYLGEDLVPGEMVTYYSAGGGGVSLRLVEENYNEEKRLDVTDGWGNGESVTYAQVLGRAVAIIPVWGRVLSTVATGTGTATLAGLIVAALLLIILGERSRGKHR